MTPTHSHQPATRHTRPVAGCFFIITMSTDTQTEPAHFLLAMWCSVNRSWQRLPGSFEYPHEAIEAATERGIYRVWYITEGRQITLETFARIGEER
jgi:hypothetical protein